MNKNILVTGGSGYIGSYVNKLLSKKGYKTFVLDRSEKNPSRYGTFILGDILNKDLVKKIIEQHSITSVFHFAAFIDVGESTKDPLKYYQNNVAGTISLLKAMQNTEADTLIFSSSAAVYGIPTKERISESHPTCPINPYGQTKLMCEQILADSSLKYIALRYFNAAGGDPDRELLVSHEKRHNLIPKALQSLVDQKEIFIFGTDYKTPDGTCVRDYVHLHDLASAHLLALDKLNSGAASEIYNLGNGSGFSVREVLSAIERVTGQKLKIIEEKRRPGDPPYLVADAQKAKAELGWKPEFNELDRIINDAWRTMKHAPQMK